MGLTVTSLVIAEAAERGEQGAQQEHEGVFSTLLNVHIAEHRSYPGHAPPPPRTTALAMWLERVRSETSRFSWRGDEKQVRAWPRVPGARVRRVVRAS